MEEKRLVEKVKQGDREAMDELVKIHYQTIFAYFYRHTGDYHRSCDLTQEVFIKAISAIPAYKNNGKFKAWLFTIASNHLRNDWRYRKSHPQEELEENTAQISETPSGIQKTELEDAMNQLPPEQKEAVVLKYYHGLKITEISKVTHTREPTVKSRLKYGLKKLKRLLGGEKHKREKAD